MNLDAQPSYQQLQAKIAELSELLDTERLDANRYRWLRDKAGNARGTRPVVVLVDADDQLVGGEVLLAYRDRKQLDNFVDRFTTVEEVSLLGVHPDCNAFEDDLPVAVVIDAGRDGLTLWELQADLPPAGTQIFARRALSQVFGSASSLSPEAMARVEDLERAAFERAFLEIYYPAVARGELRMIPDLFDRDETRYSNTLGQYLRENVERDWIVWKARAFLPTNLI